MSDIEVIECYIGDTSDILELGVQLSPERAGRRILATLDGNYTCKIGIKDGAINRSVTEKTADDLYFRGWLTPAETGSLTVGDYILGMQISNPTTTPPIVKEKQWILRIGAQAFT